MRKSSRDSDQGSAAKGVTVDLAPAERVLRDMGRVSPSDLIPLLQNLQDAYGYLPAEVLREVSERTGIPTSRMYGVISFYAQFYLQPHGKHVLTCCRGTACHVRGSAKVRSTIRSVLGIEEGETTDDMEFTFETVACLGACALAPVMVIDGTYYGKMTPRKAETILREYRGGATA